MNFTREPVVETVITSKEGCKLVIRNSRGENREEYTVDAVEVIAFGNSCFFRSLEKPKAFLLPLTEYEVIEVKEVRPILKRAQIEKPIKIGRKSKITAKVEEELPKEEEKPESEETKQKGNKRQRKKRERKTPTRVEETSPLKEEKEVEPIVKRTLLPPPTGLISEQISRYKDYLKEQGVVVPDNGEEEKPSLAEDHKIEPLSQEHNADDLTFSFGGEGVLPQMPPLDSDELDLFPQEDKVIDIHEEPKAPIAPTGEEDAVKE